MTKKCWSLNKKILGLSYYKTLQNVHALARIKVIMRNGPFKVKHLIMVCFKTQDCTCTQGKQV